MCRVCHFCVLVVVTQVVDSNSCVDIVEICYYLHYKALSNIYNVIQSLISTALYISLQLFKCTMYIPFSAITQDIILVLMN